MNFYFDIETIPTQNEAFIEELTKDISPPANYKSDEAILKWHKEKKPALMEKAIADSVFDGGMGEIVAFSCAVDDGEIYSAWRDDQKSEAELLEEINEIFKLTTIDRSGNYLWPTWTGHYITGFDLRFLFKRYVVNRIKPIIKIPHDAKPWSKDVYDTCHEWKAGSQDKGSMDFVCKALGIDGKGDFSGADVYQAWKDGEYKKISEYCDDDVIRTIQIHKALTFKG